MSSINKLKNVHSVTIREYDTVDIDSVHLEGYFHIIVLCQDRKAVRNNEGGRTLTSMFASPRFARADPHARDRVFKQTLAKVMSTVQHNQQIRQEAEMEQMFALFDEWSTE
jgi:hypothetical protein